MMHIYIGNQTIISSNNGLLPGRCQAIIWTKAGILVTGHLGTNFSQILIEILTFSFSKMCLKVMSAKWHSFCLGLNQVSLLMPWWIISKSHQEKALICKTVYISKQVSYPYKTFTHYAYRKITFIYSRLQLFPAMPGISLFCLLSPRPLMVLC